MWEDWATALKGNYRVVRFDRPGMGLTGPTPDARYNKEGEMALIDEVVDKLALSKIVLVSTSSAGEPAAAWAAQNPEHVAGVIFSNIAAGPIKPSKPHDMSLSFRLALAAPQWLGGWQSKTLWRGVLERNFANPAKVTPQLVREWSDLANRTQNWKRIPRPPGHVYFAGTPNDLSAIAAPALVLWSADDPETTLDGDGRATFETLGSSDKTLKIVADCGHMMPIECGKQSVEAALPFIRRVTGGKD
jgi:pimeloyl-ACP methyl ester carboxylesterase